MIKKWELLYLENRRLSDEINSLGIIQGRLGSLRFIYRTLILISTFAERLILNQALRVKPLCDQLQQFGAIKMTIILKILHLGITI